MQDSCVSMGMDQVISELSYKVKIYKTINYTENNHLTKTWPLLYPKLYYEQVDFTIFKESTKIRIVCKFMALQVFKFKDEPCQSDCCVA